MKTEEHEWHKWHRVKWHRSSVGRQWPSRMPSAWALSTKCSQARKPYESMHVFKFITSLTLVMEKCLCLYLLLNSKLQEANQDVSFDIFLMTIWNIIVTIGLVCDHMKGMWKAPFFKWRFVALFTLVISTTPGGGLECILARCWIHFSKMHTSLLLPSVITSVRGLWK